MGAIYKNGIKYTGKILQVIDNNGEPITIDSSLDSTSSNPVQNKVLYEIINNLQTRLAAVESVAANALSTAQAAETSADTANATADSINAYLSGTSRVYKSDSAPSDSTAVWIDTSV